MINFEPLADVVNNGKNFLITTHVNPDADAIGSEIALYFILKSLQKKINIVNYSSTPYYLQFLDPDNAIQQFHPEKHESLFSEVDVIIHVDLNRCSRTVKMEPYIKGSKALKIIIDHHEDPEDFHDHLIADTSYSSTGHIIYDFLEKTKITPISPDIAIPIYAAIMTDTGSFKYDRTTPRVHRIAAHLLEIGVNPTDVYRQIYDESKFTKYKLLGRGLESMTLFNDGNLAVMTIYQKDLAECDALETDTDGFINFCMGVEKVVVGLFFLELEDGFKASLRSKGNYSVHKLAALFGGGGHRNASGIRIRNHKMYEFKDKIIEETIIMINKGYDEVQN